MAASGEGNCKRRDYDCLGTSSSVERKLSTAGVRIIKFRSTLIRRWLLLTGRRVYCVGLGLRKQFVYQRWLTFVKCISIYRPTKCCQTQQTSPSALYQHSSPFWLLHSSPVELITATAFCTASLHKSSVDFRWQWTLLPVWSSVLVDTNTSRRLFATCFIGSQCHSEYSSK